MLYLKLKLLILCNIYLLQYNKNIKIKMLKVKFLFILLILVLFSNVLYTNNSIAQYYDAEADTIIIFEAPNDLINTNNIMQIKSNSIGLEFLFSGSGFGIGTQFERVLSSRYKLNYGVAFSGKRNSDEIEYWSYEYNNYIIPNKINRLFVIPMNIGLQRYIEIESLENSIRPFFGISAIPMFVWKMPYKADFFNEIKDSKLLFRAGASAFLGAEFGAFNTVLVSFKVKYLYVPWGGNGIESIRNFPIKNLGGIYLSLTLGGFF